MLADNLPTTGSKPTLGASRPIADTAIATEISGSSETEIRQQAQQTICPYFFGLMKTWPSELVVFEFQRVFIQGANETNCEVKQAVEQLIHCDDEEGFQTIMVRCCYILVNNWQTARIYKPIKELVELFDRRRIISHPDAEGSQRRRSWLMNFCHSQDYQDLKRFAAKYDPQGEENWSDRYTSYLLVDRYLDKKHSKAQREAAKALSHELKNRFKFDLAMYTARSQSTLTKDSAIANPTSLGDEILHLVKTLVTKRGTFSYSNLANIFRHQISGLTYKSFKPALVKYLTYSIYDKTFLDNATNKLSEKIDPLYPDYEDEIIAQGLIARTCNRVINFLILENNRKPSELFIIMLSQGNPLTLVVLLLKIILISPSSQTHLDACLAKLIRYYESQSVAECQWLLNFLDICQITFAIHADNVEYNLVQIEEKKGNLQPDPKRGNYRIFSVAKKQKK